MELPLAQESGAVISPFQMRKLNWELSPFPEGTEPSDRPTPSAPPAALQTRQAGVCEMAGGEHVGIAPGELKSLTN